MKKVVVFIVVCIGLLFLADKLYKTYSSNFINSHEANILINNGVLESEIDAFFGLAAGTFDRSQHQIVFSIEKKGDVLLDKYKNLPVKNLSDGSRSAGFRCDMDYEKISHHSFYDYNVRNLNIQVRLLNKGTPLTRKVAKSQIAQKLLRSTCTFGQINVLHVQLDTVVNLCE